MRNRKLFIIDGMPGSGKTTFATIISNYLDSRKIKHRCVLELEQDHPLLLNYIDFPDFSNNEVAQQYMDQIEQKYKDFVAARLIAIDEVTIIESALLQKTISFAFHLNIDKNTLRKFALRLFEILEPLNPSLIYFHQIDVESQWRYICNIRGNVWGSVSLLTDEDFQEAGRLWTNSQNYVKQIILSLEIPKLVIENIDYHWEEYTERIIHFVKVNLQPEMTNPLLFFNT